MKGYFYDADAANLAQRNEALLHWPGEAITRPPLTLLRGAAAN